MTEVERNEFEQRMSALTIEEQMLAVKYFDDNIMFAELQRRTSKRKAIISIVEQLAEKGGMRDVR